MRTLALLALLPGPGLAFDVSLPADCVLGETCHVQNAFDHDPGPGAADMLCGTLAYDGHDGTDIALPTLAAMEAGVAVLAPAAGVVRGIRDGMPDVPQGRPDSPDVTGRECGNGVAIAHEDGWETQVCHMAQGSVAVVEGQEVAAGDVLGRIGLSGNTEFPHVHLSVRHDGIEVDPFAPDAPPTCGAERPEGLWATDVLLPQGGVTDAGFATGVPDYAEVTAGTAVRPLAPDQPLVLFALMFGGREGDLVRLRIESPGGIVLDHDEPLERTQAQLFRAAGLRAPEGGWPAGAYTGTATLLRDGEPISMRQVEAILP